jgi:hypothetical protein
MQYIMTVIPPNLSEEGVIFSVKDNLLKASKGTDRNIIKNALQSQYIDLVMSQNKNIATRRYSICFEYLFDWGMVYFTHGHEPYP